MDDKDVLTNRRPIAARGNRAIQAASAWLARRGISANAISVASIVFAASGAAALVCLSPWGAWLCALAIVLRLLCNVFDGLVAVEHGRRTPLGPLFNEVPDRAADSILLVALGYAAGVSWLGWLAALLAAMTAYIRTLGGALGQPQDFSGPMAKQHRMWVMVGACLLVPVERHLHDDEFVLRGAAVVIAVGAAITCLIRLRSIAQRLFAAT